MKTVSVVMCTFNGAKYIREQLDSILAQTYPISEFIIQDDGSTDDTVAIVKEYADKYPIISFRTNTGERGVNGNFFSAIKLAKSDYIAISDQDDIWHPQKIEKQILSIGDNLLCSHRDNYISEDGCFIHNDTRKRNVSLLRLLFVCIPGHSFLFSKELLSMMPEQHPIYKGRCYDVAIQLAAAACDRIMFLDEDLVNFRRHSHALTYANSQDTVPSAKNAWHILITCIKQYRKAKKKSYVYFDNVQDYIQNIHDENYVRNEAILICKLEKQSGLIPFIRLQYHFMKNANRLFHTPGYSFVKIFRAFLYPVMQLYKFTK